MSTKFEYALIPFIMLMFVSVLWLASCLTYKIYEFSHRNKFENKYTCEELNTKLLSAMSKDIKVKYKKIFFGSFHYSEKKQKLFFSKKKKESKNLINILYSLKACSDIRIIKNTKSKLNFASFLEFLKYCAMFTVFLIFITIILFILGLVYLSSTSTPIENTLINLIKIFSTITLTFIIMIACFWSYFFYQYKIYVLSICETLFNEKEIELINKILSFNIYASAIR